jgi:hypothetical protein
MNWAQAGCPQMHRQKHLWHFESRMVSTNSKIAHACMPYDTVRTFLAACAFSLNMNKYMSKNHH